jgi:Aspartyl protease
MRAHPALSVSRRCSTWVASGAAVLFTTVAWTAETPPATPGSEPGELTEFVISAPEPRYVASTRRDRIGRIWTPVMINGQGPFRLALDTGSPSSAIRADVAAKLGIVADAADNVRVRGITGTSVVSTVRVNSMVVGDMSLKGTRLPVIADAFGGADGILGNEGLRDKRIYIDFVNDFVSIRLSRDEPAPEGFFTIPITYGKDYLPIVDARVGRIPVKAIISTGGQSTLGNLATRDLLLERRRQDPTEETILDVTETRQKAEGYRIAPITIGESIRMSMPRMIFADLSVFEAWGMTGDPTLLVGMDALGLLDTLIIDYRRAELHVRMRDGAPKVLF